MAPGSAPRPPRPPRQGRRRDGHVHRRAARSPAGPPRRTWSAAPTPATVRFSHPGGDPRVSDTAARAPRDGGEAPRPRRDPRPRHRHVARVPRPRRRVVRRAAARPARPTPRPARPTRRAWARTSRPTRRRSPRSRPCSPRRSRRATRRSPYNSLHTFFLVDDAGTRTPGALHVDAGRRHRARSTTRPDRDPDFLAQRARRPPRGPDRSRSTSSCTSAPTTTPPTTPPRSGRSGRRSSPAGSSSPPSTRTRSRSSSIPTNVPAGVELPPGDEILALRRLVYGHSYAQRTA